MFVMVVAVRHCCVSPAVRQLGQCEAVWRSSGGSLQCQASASDHNNCFLEQCMRPMYGTCEVVFVQSFNENCRRKQ